MGQDAGLDPLSTYLPTLIVHFMRRCANLPLRRECICFSMRALQSCPDATLPSIVEKLDNHIPRPWSQLQDSDGVPLESMLALAVS